MQLTKAAQTLLRAAAAGAMVALGAVTCLSVENGVVGALFFTMGLFVIVTSGFYLFTGKACYCLGKGPGYLLFLGGVWVGNLIGACGVAAVVSVTRIGSIAQRAQAICEVKLSDSPLSLFILAALCNMLIFIAVDGFANNPHEIGKYLSLFFGVAGFIICGYEHCVANMFYITLAGAWSGRAVACLAVVTAGNFAGSLVLPLIKAACMEEKALK